MVFFICPSDEVQGLHFLQWRNGFGWRCLSTVSWNEILLLLRTFSKCLCNLLLSWHKTNQLHVGNQCSPPYAPKWHHHILLLLAWPWGSAAAACEANAWTMAKESLVCVEKASMAGTCCHCHLLQGHHSESPPEIPRAPAGQPQLNKLCLVDVSSWLWFRKKTFSP